MATPEAAAVGEEAGALEGEFWFPEEFAASGNDAAAAPQSPPQASGKAVRSAVAGDALPGSLT